MNLEKSGVTRSMNGSFVPRGLSDACPLIPVPTYQRIATWAGI